ncbi:type I-E CRISPR-associated protein Cse2/CasB [Streptomyces hydrogenans]|uniref:type I-E CRISPR-associated protein Cse2/CasB n=1 Tax=Streptomyces hydrogenans TaxID=1873719 RepID=UPI00368EC1B0
MTTPEERRAGYDDFVAYIHDLCAIPGIRTTLAKGRGRPVEQCGPMDRYLTRSTIGRTGRRSYYTVAALIALAGPAAHTPGVKPEPPADDTLTGPAADALGITPSPPDATAPPGSQLPALAAAPDDTSTPSPDTSHDSSASDWYQRPNLGATLAAAVTTRAHHEERTDAQLHVLTRLGDDQVHRRLPTLTTRLLSDNLTPDWAVLLADLIQRPYQRDTVSLRWRDAFYQGLDRHHRT